MLKLIFPSIILTVKSKKVKIFFVGWFVPHPSLFVKREVYNSLEKIFDTSLRLAADYELILRLLMIKRIFTRNHCKDERWWC